MKVLLTTSAGSSRMFGPESARRVLVCRADPASCSGRRRLTEREGRPAEYLMAALPSVLHKSTTSLLLPLTLTPEWAGDAQQSI